MTTYPQRVKDNILPLSVGKTLPEAFEEWTFTDDVYDCGEPIEICQLCDHTDLRYHFQIRNSINSNELWVGSECIKKFGISVFENGQKLSPDLVRKKLDRLIDSMHLESCINTLTELANQEDNKILKDAIKYYRRNKYLTPNFAFVVAWKLSEYKISYQPSFFKVLVNNKKYKNDLDSMNSFKRRHIWVLLSPQQRKAAEKRKSMRESKS